MKGRRRVVLQLTPLLDLLLVVMFAQYFQVHAESERVASDLQRRKESAVSDRVAAEANRARCDEDLLGCRARGAALAARVEALSAENDELHERRAEAERRRTESDAARAEDRRVAAVFISETLGISRDAVDAALAETDGPSAARVRATIEQLRGASPGRVLRRLREMDEMRRHFDFWHIHVDDTDRLMLQINEEAAAPISGPHAGAEQVRQAVREAIEARNPATRPNVILALSHGGLSRRVYRRAAEDALDGLRQALSGRFLQARFFEARMGRVDDFASGALGGGEER